MTPDRDLSQFCATVDTGAAFTATLEGGFSMLTPITARDEAWLKETVADEATWMGPTLVVENRYFPDLADAIIEAGFLFERQAFPN